MPGYCGLVKIELNGGPVLYLSEGAEVKWGSDVFVPRHATYGGIGAVETLTEGVGNEVPALVLELLPPSTTAAADLVMPGVQKSLLTAWLAEYDSDTMTVTGTPVALFRGFLDQARLSRQGGALALRVSVVSLLEQLFELNTGNSLSPSRHKLVWPGETGEDQATGLVLQDAWGVQSPGNASSSYGSGFAGILERIRAQGAA